MENETRILRGLLERGKGRLRFYIDSIKLCVENFILKTIEWDGTCIALVGCLQKKISDI